MSVLSIKKYGEPVLRQKCKPVSAIDKNLLKLIRDMFETMYAAPGLGLSANQVGVPVRVCVVDVRPEGRRQPVALINPKIVQKEGKLTVEEGCLSLPGLMAGVRRARKVKVEALNEEGLPIIVEGDGILARALQHEIDHLEGKVFIDYLPVLQRLRLQYEIRKRRKHNEW